MGKNNLYKMALAAVLAVSISPVHALDNPASLSFDGVLDDGSGNPLSGPVALKIQVYNPAADCLLFEEDHASVPLDADGAFTIKVGTGSRASSAVDGGVAWKNVFANTNTAIRGAGANCGSGYTPAGTHSRKLRVTVNGATVLSPDFTLTSVPFATVADTVQGMGPAEFVHTAGGSAVNGFIKMNQANAIRFADSGSANYVAVRAPGALGGNLDFILPASAGTSGQVLRTDGSGNLSWVTINATQLQGGAVSGTAPANGQVLTWNSSNNSWTPMNIAGTGGGSGTVTMVTAGTGLLGGTITTTGVLSVDTGTTANKIVKLDGSAQLPAVSGALLTNVNASSIATRAVAATAPSNGQVLTWNGSIWTPMTVVGSGGGTDAMSIQGRAVTAAAPGNNAILKFNATSNSWLLGADDTGGGGSQWTTNASDIFYSTGNVGIYTSNPQGALDVNGSGANSSIIVPRATTANRPTGINGMIRYNTTLSKLETFENGAWVNLVDAGGGAVTSVAGRTGAVTLTLADIAGAGTAATKDFGLSANNLVELNGSAQLPAVNGSLLTNVNASAIATRPVSNAAPTTNQALGWNGSQWMPMTISGTGGSVSYASITNGGGVYMTYAPNGVNCGNGEVLVWNNILPGWECGASGGADNLGNHTATANIVLGANWLSGDGGAEGIRVDAAGLVGIGTGAPTNSLHVNRATSGFPLMLSIDSGTNVGLSMNIGGSIFGSIDINTTGDLRFDAAGNTVNEMVIKGDGRVGIGTLAPNNGAILDLNGTGTLSSLIVPRGTTAQRPGVGVNGMIRYNTNLSKFESYEGGQWVGMGTGFPLLAPNGSAASPVFSFSAGTSTGLFYPGAQTIGFSTAGSEKMRLDNAGNVGIGTMAPFSRLQVHNSANSWPLSVTGGSAGYVGISLVDNSGTIFSNINMSTASGDLLFDADGDANYEMVLWGDGRVGIGTSIPSAGTVLDIRGTGGLSSMIVPRDTAAARPAGVNGMIRYNTTAQKFEAYQSGQWLGMVPPPPPERGMQLFTTGGTFTVPPGVTSVKVVVIGAAGGGAGATGRGGDGGSGMAWVNNLTPGSNITVSVGVGGDNTTPTNGTNSSFGTFVTGTGGVGGNNSNGAAGNFSTAPSGGVTVSSASIPGYPGLFQAGRGMMMQNGENGVVFIEW